VGGCSKPYESDQNIWLAGCHFWIGIYSHEVFSVEMKKIYILAAFLMVACGQAKKENAVIEKPSELPAFMMTLTSGQQLMSDTLPGNLILIFYNPGCDHCQREAEAIRKDLDAFNHHTIYFIAASPLETITQFAADYDLAGLSNIIFARAEISDVIREMGPIGTPALFIYSKDKQLVKRFDGETDVEEIIKFI
jgi:peroxiredoxin